MRFTKRFVTELHSYNNSFPNLQALDVVPGSILTCSKGTWLLKGRLDERITDEALKAKVAKAIERTHPREAGEGAVMQDIKLKSTGTTVVSSNDGVKVDLPNGMKVAAKVVCSFAHKSDYLFDTTNPAYWYTFSSSESALMLDAALTYLATGEYLVTGAGWAKRWLWYASRTQNSVVGFSADVDVDALGVGNLADLFVNADVKVTVDSGGSLNDNIQNSVAFFSCVRKQRSVLGIFGDPVIRAEGSRAIDEATGDTLPIKPGETKNVLLMGDATVAELGIDED